MCRFNDKTCTSFTCIENFCLNNPLTICDMRINDIGPKLRKTELSLSKRLADLWLRLKKFDLCVCERS